MKGLDKVNSIMNFRMLMYFEQRNSEILALSLSRCSPACFNCKDLHLFSDKVSCSHCQMLFYTYAFNVHLTLHFHKWSDRAVLSFFSLQKRKVRKLYLSNPVSRCISPARLWQFGCCLVTYRWTAYFSLKSLSCLTAFLFEYLIGNALQLSLMESNLQEAKPERNLGIVVDTSLKVSTQWQNVALLLHKCSIQIVAIHLHPCLGLKVAQASITRHSSSTKREAWVESSWLWKSHPLHSHTSDACDWLFHAPIQSPLPFILLVLTCIAHPLQPQTCQLWWWMRTQLTAWQNIFTHQGRKKPYLTCS